MNGLSGDARTDHDQRARRVSGLEFRGATMADLFTFRDGKIVIKNSYRKNRPAI